MYDIYKVSVKVKISCTEAALQWPLKIIHQQKYFQKFSLKNGCTALSWIIFLYVGNHYDKKVNLLYKYIFE